MEEIKYPINGFSNAHEVIAEAERTRRPIRDLIGRGLPEDYTREQILEAYRKGECSEGYVAQRLKISRIEIRSIVGELSEKGE